MLDYNSFKYMTFGRKSLFNEMMTRDTLQARLETPEIYSTPEQKIYMITYNHMNIILGEFLKLENDIRLKKDIAQMILNYGVSSVDTIGFITKVYETVYTKEMFKYRMFSSYRKSRENISNFEYSCDPTSGSIKLIRNLIDTEDKMKLDDILHRVLKVNMDKENIIKYPSCDIAFLYQENFVFETLFKITEFASISQYLGNIKRFGG